VFIVSVIVSKVAQQWGREEGHQVGLSRHMGVTKLQSAPGADNPRDALHCSFV